MDTEEGEVGLISLMLQRIVEVDHGLTRVLAVATTSLIMISHLLLELLLMEVILPVAIPLSHRLLVPPHGVTLLLVHHHLEALHKLV